MKPIALAAELRKADANAIEPIEVLIARAAQAVVHNAITMMGGAYGHRVLVVAGPGNNGADGRAAAQLLRLRGTHVDEITPQQFTTSLRLTATDLDLVIDAAYGTGFRLSPDWNPPTHSPVPVLAVDIPSGVNADTGEVSGPVLAADVTVTFGALKPGLLFGDGSVFAGEVRLVDIGIEIPEQDLVAEYVDFADVAEMMRFRVRDAHKWKHGVKVIAGSRGMTGAARLTAEAALRSGAGIVHGYIPGVTLLPTDPVEVVWHCVPDENWGQALHEDDARFKSCVLGPGIGRADATAKSAADYVITCPLPMVVDGDGLYALGVTNSMSQIMGTSAARILTPHDGEYLQMCGEQPGIARIAAAKHLARLSGSTVLLKGQTTVVANSERAWVMQAGDQRLATAGSGDVLSGIIGAFLALGMTPENAAVCGAVVHGQAALSLHSVGVKAGELPQAVAAVLSEIRDDK